MFRFAYPDSLYLLAVIPLLIALSVYSFLRIRKRMRLFSDPTLLHSLISNYSRPRIIVKICLLFISVALLIVMLARPQFGLSEHNEEHMGIEVFIMLDVSNSMLASDVTPSRLERSKLLISNLVDKMKEDKIGLGVFAGEAYPQLPLTTDHTATRQYLTTITPEMVTLQGTNLAAAIELASSCFTEQKKVGKAIIIITDGENHTGEAEEAAASAAKEGRHVYILGVGTSEGSTIPAATGFLRSQDGEVVVSRLNESMCREVAQKGNGAYFQLDNTNSAQQELLVALNQLEKAPNTSLYTTYDEQFQAVGLIVLVLLFIEFLLFDAKNPWLRKIQIFKTHETTK